MVLLDSRAALAANEFEVPADCGTKDLFDASIRARVGEREADSILGALALRIREQPGTYTMTMQVGPEMRLLQDQDCRQLFRAAVVVAIALWEAPRQSEPVNPVQPRVTLDTSGVGGTASTRSTPSAPTTARISAPFGNVWPNRSAMRRHHHLQLGAEFGIVAGLQPELGPFYGIRAALDARRFGVAGSIRWAPARGDRDANDRGVEVAAIGARGAAYFKPLPFLGFEFGARADYLEGTGLGSSQTRTANLWAFGPVLGAWAIPLRIGGAFISLGAEGHLALLRPRFEITGYGEVFRVSPIGGVAFLTIGYRFQ